MDCFGRASRGVYTERVLSVRLALAIMVAITRVGRALATLAVLIDADPFTWTHCGCAKMKTAVAFIIFNRPEVTRRVFAAIRIARPPILMVIADGPREGRTGEAQKCAEVRAVIETGVDWPCEVRKNYADTNLGCGRRVTSGLDWVFEQVGEAIILEDDCLPDATFFPYCEELLERYRDDERVAQIGGSNHQYRHFERPQSYFFSRYNHIWGWAGWRRSWASNDREMRGWPAFDAGAGCARLFRSSAVAGFWRREWTAVAKGEIDTWDLQWSFACLSRGMVTALPTVSLVENIGFGPEATHTKKTRRRAPTVGPMRFPMIHASTTDADADADDHMEKWLFSKPTLAQLIIARLMSSRA